MSWAKVKKINSDMSKPLDILFDELIKGQKRFVASDNTIAVITSSSIPFSGTEPELTVGTFTPKISGSIKLNVRCTNNDYTDRYIAVYLKDENGNNIITTGMTTVIGEMTCYGIANVVPNETYSVVFKGTFGVVSISIDYVDICASIVDANTFDYTYI